MQEEDQSLYKKLLIYSEEFITQKIYPIKGGESAAAVQLRSALIRDHANSAFQEKKDQRLMKERIEALQEWTQRELQEEINTSERTKERSILEANQRVREIMGKVHVEHAAIKIYHLKQSQQIQKKKVKLAKEIFSNRMESLLSHVLSQDLKKEEYTRADETNVKLNEGHKLAFKKEKEATELCLQEIQDFKCKYKNKLRDRMEELLNEQSQKKEIGFEREKDDKKRLLELSGISSVIEK